ncbi:amidohydrolase family protein [Pelagibacterium sp. H642]|uniref:amidohydrolase family protein n=1 Tax=Pelagibacterium sp. H642 TaxID=1881069 RepID=UPI002815FF20|nr:amidohydrolase family protein [Pelagibacterium sp. H642]WMT92560.1 amidohydrolase family protein [Pelagibacterium sp. H642]
MDIVISNAAIITGDGETFWPRGQVAISSDRIAAIVEGHDEDLNARGTLRIDAKGAIVFPGIINGHAHGCAHGPAMPSGSPAFPQADIDYFRNRHLLAGTTTLVNVCGLALPEEIDGGSGASHPLQVYVTSAHTPSAIAAADAVDGAGLSGRHREMNLDRAIALGAIALGEGGGGQTLGGGAQDYAFLPRAILRDTGVSVAPRDAKSLKDALLGRALDRADRPPDSTFVALCKKLDLLRHSTVDAVADIIKNTVMKSVVPARRGLAELAQASSRTGLPAILHTAAPSAKTVIDLARSLPTSRLIAAHCNHPSCTPEQAVATARSLRELGVTIDVSTLDCIVTHWRNTAENLDALIGEGLVDTLSTDFAGGHWDGILEAVHRMIVKGHLSAPQAIALATGNVARLFPAFHDRGLLSVGKRADITIADRHNLSRVRHVIIGGKRIIQDGANVATSSSLIH